MVPVIDFSSSELKPGSPQWESARFQVRMAAEKYGCFEAKINFGIEAPVFGSLKEFFDLPPETKYRVAGEQEYYSGYVGLIPDMALFERIGIDDPTNLERVESFTNVLWPQGNSSFSKAIQHSANQLHGIIQLIMRIIVESYGLEKYMEDHLNSANYSLRVSKYDKGTSIDEGMPATEKTMGMATHTDKGTLAVLCQNQVHGFELRTRDGHWICVKPSPDSLIVVLGECYHVWTNGRFYAPCRRVMSTANNERYTIGLFAYPKPGYVLKAPKELVDKAHPALYRPLEFSELLNYNQIMIPNKEETKNKGKGGKNRKTAKNEEDGEKRKLEFKQDGQDYAQVLRMLGNGRCEAMCIDGTKRLCHIRGKMHKKVWVAVGDIILVELRGYQDGKADIILKYTPDEAKLLKAYGELPENTRGNVRKLDKQANEAGDDDIEFSDEGEYLDFGARNL